MKSKAKTKDKKNVTNMVIAQSGGPSMVINASLAGAIREAKRPAARKRIGKILGARHGIQGILAGDYINLTSLSEKRLARLSATPSSALGSCRMKPTVEDCRKIFEEFRRQNVGFFFYIGGNDSADTARIIGEEAAKENYPLVVYHVPKTIDNDLRSCDHTPGYASAARFVACALKGDDLDNRALGGVKIDVIMGRDAGFLTAAAALARTHEGDGPHLIYLPERPFSLEKFAKDVKEVMKKHNRCVVAVSEGIRDAKGELLAKKFANGERDSHGNLQLSGSGALGDFLAGYLKSKMSIKRVRADTFGYLQRSFPGIATEQDIGEAESAGRWAVQYALKVAEGSTAIPMRGTVGIRRRVGRGYALEYVALPARAAAKDTRSMPDQFIAKNGHDVTPAFMSYARPFIGSVPHCEIL